MGNPNGTRYPWLLSVWNFETKGMGSASNTMHSFYIEGRPDSTFELNNMRVLGSRGSSAIKTTRQNLFVRHSYFSTTEEPGVESTAKYSMHTPIDVPAVSTVVIYGNRFEAWRTDTVGVRPARRARSRHDVLPYPPGLFGADIPAYPISPGIRRMSQSTASSPGKGWSEGPETFVSDPFWQAVKAKPVSDLTNPFTFKHYVAFNQFTQMPGSLPVKMLRDDGTHPVANRAARRATSDPLHAHAPLWIERSVTFFYGNEYGPGVNADVSKLETPR